MASTLESRRKSAEEGAEQKGMERLGISSSEETPDWIEVPDEFSLSASEGEYTRIVADKYVYRLISSGGGDAIVYRQLKSEYFETTTKEGTCPNCQSYVSRQEGDDYLTCHRCGWQYKPLKERVKNLL